MNIARLLGLAFGFATHVIFAVTVCFLVPFLYGGVGTGHALGRDALLALQFGVLHSFLLLPWTRKQWECIFPGALYGCIFSLITCASLLATFAFWQSSGVVVWRVHGVLWFMMTAAFIASWITLISSLHLTGLGYQTGWTPFWAWARGQKLAATPLPAAGRISLPSPPRLSQLSRPGMVHADDDARPRRANRDLDRIHLRRKLFEGSATGLLPRRFISTVPVRSSWLSARALGAIRPGEGPKRRTYALKKWSCYRCGQRAALLSALLVAA